MNAAGGQDEKREATNDSRADARKRNPWRGEPPPAPIPSSGPKHSDTVEIEAAEVDANLDFAVGPRKPPLPAAPPIGAHGSTAPNDRGRGAAVEDEGTESAAEASASNEAEDEGETVEFASKLEDSEMDMTPMVDIVFQLLIFFMVTAAFSMQKTKPLPAPKDDRPSTAAVPQDVENDGDFVVVLLDSYNTFRVQTPDWDEEAPSEQDLLIKLRRAKNEGASDGKTPTKLMIKAHGDSLHEKVIAALDAGAAVGMEQIQLQTVEQDEE